MRRWCSEEGSVSNGSVAKTLKKMIDASKHWINFPTVHLTSTWVAVEVQHRFLNQYPLPHYHTSYTDMNSTTAGPSAISPASTLTLLSNVPTTHPSFISLLVAHTPFANPSSLPSSALNKLLGRINSAVLAKDNESERKAAWIISKEVVLQDQEGYALNQWGKNWVTAALGALTVSHTLCLGDWTDVRLWACRLLV
jgi:hypothetical protein